MKHISYNGEVLCSFEDDLRLLQSSEVILKGDTYRCVSKKPYVVIKTALLVGAFFYTLHVWPPVWTILWESEEYTVARISKAIFDE